MEFWRMDMKEKIIPIRSEKKKSREKLSDEAIAAACGTGDPVALSILFERFQNSVARYICRLTGSFQVEDLVQSTFLEVVKGKTIYDGRASVVTWLFSIATNIVRHERRSYSRKKRLEKALKNEPGPSACSIDKKIDLINKVEKAHEVLKEISESQREAFVLCILEGLSAKETAVILNTSESAVWKRICKARAIIRKKVLEDK
jgi:RNA polymerase sigma-70 factor, ECF subfamily